MTDDGARTERIRRLPSGPHGLPVDLVARNQRERLIAAMAEECAERGYAETSVAEIARRAGVSTASFYRQFKDRRECMLVSFEELSGRLIEAIEGTCGEGDRPNVELGLRTVAALLAADRPTARLLAVEIAAVGPEGVRLQQGAIDRIAALLRRQGTGPTAVASSSPSPEWIAVAAMVAWTARRIAEGGIPTAEEFETAFHTG